MQYIAIIQIKHAFLCIQGKTPKHPNPTCLGGGATERMD
jgi:hypothetical protein